MIDSEDYPRPFDLEGFLRDGYLPGFAGDWLDPADLVLDQPGGLVPDDAPTTRDVMGPRDGGRRA